MERARCKPWGLNGGLSGSGNAVAVHRYGNTDETHFPSAKALNQVLQPGDAYIIRSGGGGGYGSPLQRDLATLERDVRCGYVTQGGRGEILRRGVPAGFAGARQGGDRCATRRAWRSKGCRMTSRSPRSSSRFRPRRSRRPASVEHEKLTEEERVAFAMRCRCCS